MGRVASAENNFQLHFPMLASEWDYEKNYPDTPDKFLSKSNKKFWWICSICSHEWQLSIADRHLGGCPACANKKVHIDGRNSMAKTHPNLAAEYVGNASKIIAGTNKKLDWKCNTCSHEWQASGVNRVTGRNCPACANKVIHSDGRNSMSQTHPELAKEYQGNPDKIIASVDRKIKWKCSACDNIWLASGDSRTRGNGCPACAGNALHSDGRNSLANTHPELAKEYRGDPRKVMAGSSSKKLNWKCSVCDNEWSTTGAHRISGKGCPSCAGNALHSDGRNSMASTHPELAKEYQGDPTKIKAGSNKKLPWKCEKCQFEWKAVGNSRASGSGCPVCANSGFQPHLEAHYYVHEILNKNTLDRLFFKGGISGNWIRRMREIERGLPDNMVIKNVEILLFEKGQDALELESRLKQIEEIRSPKREFNGGDELFLYNPLTYAKERGLI